MILNIDWLNRLAKWRSVFAGWQLGTRASGDPECEAVRDHREATLMLQAEMNAVVELLLKHKIISEQEWSTTLSEEAKLLGEALEKRFPGIEATDYGLDMDARAAQTMKGWKP